MAKNIIIIIVSIIIFSVNSVFASTNETYFNEHEKGWHWYKDPKKEEIKDENDDINPVEEMNAVHATIKKTLDKAVLHPNKENVKDYIILQNQVMSRANQFNHNWQAVILENPDLNYSLLHPTNNLAKQVENDLSKNVEEKTIADFAKNNELYYFYKSTCLYCQRFAPILKEFAEKYGFKILPITTDGVSLPEFPNSYVDQGEAKLYRVTMEPALFAVNPKSHQAAPVAFGLTSQSEIKKNIQAIVTKFDGDVR